MKTVHRPTSGSPRGPWWSFRALAAAFAAGGMLRPFGRWLFRRRPEPAPEERAPDRGAETEPEPPERRRFLQRVAMTAGAVVAALLAAPFVSFLFRTPETLPARVWRPIGRVDEFVVGHTVQVTYLDPTPLPWAGFAAESAAWLRRDSETEFVAFTVYCTHTGCPVRWIETADLFLCPCHGGAFYRDGTVAAGPPPVPLTRYPVRVENGVVEILTTPIPGRV